MSARVGGYGREPFGDPLGSGGPVFVVRALAVAGQVVRVVFTEEPLHRSPAGAFDALNPSNYRFATASGQATAPVPVGVDRRIVVGPTYGVGNGTGPDVGLERGVDVHVDRQLIVGITYRVTAQQIAAMAGGGLGAPGTAVFPGVTRLDVTRPPERRLDLVDLANPPVLGHWLADAGGDLAAEEPAAGTKKRILRRLTTYRGGFSFLPGYGLAQRLKGIATVAQLAALKVDALGQVLAEPDVASATVDVSLSGDGVLVIAVRAKTRRGVVFTLGATFEDGHLSAAA